jgi:hypothetical protein
MESPEHSHSRRRYLAASVPQEVRTCIARAADAFLAEGVSLKRQREIWCGAGYEISEPTFRRQRARVHEGHDPLSNDKSSGRPKALTDRQIMVGFCIKMMKMKKLAFEIADALLRTTLV